MSNGKWRCLNDTKCDARPATGIAKELSGRRKDRTFHTKDILKGIAFVEHSTEDVHMTNDTTCQPK